MSERKKPRWSLSHKGLIYISAILLVQLIFFAWLALLLQEQEFIAEKEYHSKQIFGHVNWLSTLISGSMLGSIGYSVNKDEDCLRLIQYCQKGVPTELNSLRDTLSNDTEQKKELDKVERVWTELKNNLDRNASAKSAQEWLMKQEQPLKQSLEKLLDSRHRIAYEERTRFDPNKESPTESRLKQKYTLVAGVAVSILGAVFTFMQFSKGVARRIAVLTENSVRLASGQQLLLVNPGSDEIANLDQTFHEMADALTTARKSLEASQQRLLTLLDNMPVGLLVVDSADTVEFANAAAKNLFASADPSGAKLHALLPVPKAESDGLEAGRPMEIEFTNAAGRHYFIEVSKRNIMMIDGERTLQMLQDVTERHELEQLKQEFVSMVSHDLRSPLSSIGLFLTLVKRLPEGTLPKHISDNLGIADRNTKRLLALVNDLLDIEKLHAGKLAMDFDLHDAQPIVEEAVDSLRSLAESRKVILTTEGTDFEFAADKDRLVQVLINLISNAIKFSPSGSTVKVTVEKEKNLALFQVADQGRGVPDEHRSAIFEKYKQIAGSDGARGKGTGLGLPICKAIVEEHHGTIGVTDADGAGSIFWFRVPIEQKELSG